MEYLPVSYTHLYKIMREIIMMLERELSNDGLIYIYRASDGKWYAYEQSAFYLSRMMLELSLDRYVREKALWLARAEIDVNRIPWDKVIDVYKRQGRLLWRDILLKCHTVRSV